MRRLALALFLTGLLAAPAAAHPLGNTGLQLSIGKDNLPDRTGKKVTATAAQTPPATPRAECGPGSRPETGMQGRVPPGSLERLHTAT